MDGAKLRELREHWGLSQRDFGRLVKAHPVHVGKMENGTYPVSARVSHRLALLSIVRLVAGKSSPTARKLWVLATAELGMTVFPWEEGGDAGDARGAE